MVVGLLLTVGLAILAILLSATSELLEQVRKKESDYSKLIYEATSRTLEEKMPDASDFFNLVTVITEGNNYIPVIVVQDGDQILAMRNLEKPDTLMSEKEKQAALAELKATGDSIVSNPGSIRLGVYFGESHIVSQFRYVRWTQLFAVAVFAVIVYLYLTQKRRRERDNLWRGLALETAHQLGTPVSALGAWREMLEVGAVDARQAAGEIEKDVRRINEVATRFSKIGSEPQLTEGPLVKVVGETVEYLSRRVSKNISFHVVEKVKDVSAPHEPTLIRWAVENICRNAVDAISGSGSITIYIDEIKSKAVIDIHDTGKGMSHNAAQHVFDAGYTTKERGWGIGLALVRRIAREYHKGNVFVLDTKVGLGTTFRIELPK